jgi:putative ABC transport system substrate-binding protein
MQRREFITLLGGAAAWPLGARAQQPMPVIGFLCSGSPDSFAHLVDAFRRGLNETGYTEGRNVVIEYHWAKGRYDRLPTLAADHVRRGVAVVVAVGNTAAALAAKAATSTIPIVFNVGSDPVAVGLVASLNRPGGNLTGLTLFATSVAAKRLQLLCELAPAATVIGVLANYTNSSAEVEVTSVQDAAREIGRQIRVFNARNERDIDSIFTTLLEQPIGALYVGSDPLFTSQRTRIVGQAAVCKVPTMYFLREFVEAGGLCSYGADLSDNWRQVGIYTGQILKGEKVGELPVRLPTKFELVINLKTAKALGLTVPLTLLATADEVIE